MKIETPEPENEPMRGGALIVVGLCAIGFGVFMYSVFSGLEASGGSIRMNIIFVGLYKLFGKIGTTAVFWLIGVGCVWVGARRWMEE